MHKQDILRFLMKASSGYISGAAVAKRLGLSRTAVWKHIKALKDEGYDIKAAPSRGYRIIGIPDIIDPDEVERRLRTKNIGRRLHLFQEVGSTNSLAMKMAAEGAPEGSVIISETQTGGRGRLGRVWVSPRGNIYMSVILRPKLQPHKAPLMTLTAAVAAATAIRRFTGLQAEIKWPNDIFIKGKKAGGILTEMSAEPDSVRYIVLGIGINVNPDMALLPHDVRRLATSLEAEKSERIDRSGLLAELLNELEKWYQIFQRNGADVIREWEGLSMTIGKRVVVADLTQKIEGLAEGIDHEGRLIIRLDNGGLCTVAAGDVTIIK